MVVCKVLFLYDFMRWIIKWLIILILFFFKVVKYLLLMVLFWCLRLVLDCKSLFNNNELCVVFLLNVVIRFFVGLGVFFMLLGCMFFFNKVRIFVVRWFWIM